MTHSIKSPTVSVIIPTYNREDLICKPIRSVLNQSYQNFEIIVVDDHSTDDTEKVVAGINDSRIRYIRHQRNSGAAVARNTGIENSKGAYVAFLDSDDEWLPEKLEKQLNLFQKCGSEIGCIYTGLAAVDKFNQVKSVKSPSYRGCLRDRLLYSNCIGTPSTVMVKRNYLDQVQGFDPNMPSFIEDVDLWLRLSEHCQFEVLPEVLTLYSDNNSGDRLTLNHKLVVEGILSFIKKHHSRSIFSRSEQRQSKLSSRDIAESLFDTGRTLLCNGFLISHSEAIEVGRQYHMWSFKTNFLNSKSLLYYAVSLLGQDAYFSLIKSENEMRSQVKRILDKISR
ncbi:glycosyltransferase family A protein [Chamaesiphon sp. OTE_75_metabat_556]|uniref:glycosyltransferase family 2 protein n=1 Tax=Chamaesiphon sp. OTE_75_metabat_556 TaxID=2964692 RepID=UPI00286D4D98|nr:glycosyltransferase family A protein [Chamaesiphon sp. OTE_75_metabat_556]